MERTVPNDAMFPRLQPICIEDKIDGPVRLRDPGIVGKEGVPLLRGIPVNFFQAWNRSIR